MSGKPRKRGRYPSGVLSFVALALMLFTAPFAHAAPTDRIIIRFKAGADGHPVRKEVDTQLEAEFSKIANRPLRLHRAMSGRGEFVLKLDKRLSDAEVEAIVNRLKTHSHLEYTAPDRIAFPQLTPNDPQFGSQWNLQAASGGINAPSAWDITTGSASIVVAVVDTGILPHADLAGRTVPGYDFVSDLNRSNDGNGRDADPTDPGDWVTAAEAASGPLVGCPVADSSWHGTRLAGVIAASGNNAQGIAGLNWASKILPVRAIGKCGGHTSDIVDAIRWAAGIPVAGVPDNANPARVINLSVSTEGVCDAAFQSAINDVTGIGAVVVAAAGNQGQNAANYTPASCQNVIAVGALDRNGGLTAYSNSGPQIAVSAPGGTSADAILSSSDSGTQSPTGDSAYIFTNGTSLAAAQVSGVVSLILSHNSSLSPAQVRDWIRNTAQPFTTNAASQGSYANCTQTLCGAGILNPYAVLAKATSVEIATPQVRGGLGQVIGLRSDATVWTWGEVGNPFPQQVPGLGGIVQVASGGYDSSYSLFPYSLALRAGGTVLAWGYNGAGQLGDGTTASRVNPIQVPGLTNVVSIAAAVHSLALKSDGTVWAWGANTAGKLGDGTTTERHAPVQLLGPGGVGFLSGVVAIAAGGVGSLALKSDGTVWAWGSNVYGGLGDGTTTNRTTPVQVLGPGGVGFLSGVVAIVAGNVHSLALKSDGTVWAWGNNSDGRLGDGTTTNRTTPVQVLGPGGVGFLSGVAGIAAGNSHSLVLKSDGTVWAWGSNSNRNLGDGTTANRSIPVQAQGLSNVIAVSAGFNSSVALASDGALRAWGYSSYGLGTGTSAADTVPPLVRVAYGGENFSLGLADPNMFAPLIEAPLGSVVISNPITLIGIGTNVPISITGGQYSVNGAAYTSAAGTVNEGD
ncbi:MAG: hypothetical protein A3H35_20000, partial [Betaproteobacteria bacterium RIFCSPLOWO2_02_FULL_62_17]